MIPVNLKLSNFTSYGENPPELNFTKFHLAAISGPNGAGKSSLLDAITWALWGSSRAGDSSDALVKLGASDMSVEFSFELNKHIFTVKRRRSKKGGGSTALEFWSGSASSPQTHNLTEGTIKATQQKIIDALHLTFETFTNSSFLRQGNADEFTTKGPTDRKRILADILGLDHYDKLEEKAKERSKDAQTKLSLFEYQILEIEAELSQKDERKKRLSEIRNEGEEANKKLKEIEILIKVVEGEKQIIQTKVNNLKEQRERNQKIKLELEELDSQIQLKKLSLKEYQDILAKKLEIEEKKEKINLIETEKKGLDEKRTLLINIKNELVEIQKTLQEREGKRKDAITKVELQIKALSVQNEAYLQQIENLKNKKNLCPTCGQDIGVVKNKELVDENLKKINKNKQELETLNQTLGKYQKIILPEVKLVQEKESEVKKLTKETENYIQITLQLTELAKYNDLFLKLQQAKIAVKTQTEAIADLEKIYQDKNKDLKSTEEFDQNLKLNLVKLIEVEEKINSQNIIREEIQERVLDLRSKYGEANQLVSRTTQLEELFQQRQLEKNKLTKDKEIFEELALAFGKKGIQAMIIENAIPEIEDEANRLLDKLTDGRMKVDLATQKETKTKIANIDGTKDHAIVETLDIVISDEMGERNYELYSGGETFRVNFALRLAISKLLTHRAGAKLQFLVIDEGFGTQDAAGRARLVEVIDAIKNDFEKILIITHIEELKEEFPVRIEVSKTEVGSTFEIVGI